MKAGAPFISLLFVAAACDERRPAPPAQPPMMQLVKMDELDPATPYFNQAGVRCLPWETASASFSAVGEDGMQQVELICQRTTKLGADGLPQCNPDAGDTPTKSFKMVNGERVMEARCTRTLAELRVDPVRME